MSTRSSRLSPSQSSPLPSHGSKLPKFLQKQNRDRSKSASLTDPGGSTSAMYTHSQSDSIAESSSTGRRKGGSRILGRSGKSRPSQDEGIDTEGEGAGDERTMEETPVIVEPSPRPRTRSERLANGPPEIQASVSLMPSSSARLTELPTRLSGWFQHTFSASTNDLSLPALLTQQQLSSVASPKGKSSALLTAAKHGRGQLDKAVRYLLDSDATPDKCPDPIWLLGVQHSGYEPPPPSMTPSPRRSSVDSRRSPAPSSSSSSIQADHSLSQSLSSPSSKNNPGANWPPEFYADFTSRIWLTYRSQFSPIRDSSLTALESEIGEVSQSPRRWNSWLSGEKGWTSDQGWGCMLRTGQSLLANALLHLLLGREWRRPPNPVYTADYATYVRLITWFLDSPSPLCPFSVHRMALAGKELGKDVGQWFGPSTAAGAIKTLVHAFPDANLGVAVAVDSVVYQSDVYAASHGHLGSPRRFTRASWGSRPVLVLVGIRLGLDGVNPIYYETIKTLYTFPQSVGIAGGRPSSSYYFVGAQADSLFYLDPHHARPAVPLRPPPSSSNYEAISRPPSQDQWERERQAETDWETDSRRKAKYRGSRSPTSPASSVRTGSSTFSYHHPSMSPSPLQKQLSSSTASSSSHGRWQSASESEEQQLDADQEHYINAYSVAELKTFHCDKVRKIHLSGLDPSMLIGFSCKDEVDWLDFRKRMAELSRKHKPIFSIQDEPPSWPSDSDEYMGLESISEPDIDMDMPDDEEGEDFLDARSTSASPAPGGSVDTEEDPIGPITPGPSSRTTFDMGDEKHPRGSMSSQDESVGDDDLEDDDWVDPSLPTPLAQPPVPAPTVSDTQSMKREGKHERKKSKKSAVPVVRVPSPPEQQHYPFPVTVEAPEDSVVSSRTSSGRRVPQLHTVRARDGGRTQSGGVKGVPTDD
ncbi:hypothetical protein NEOLEDRAFT_1163305 [Neolentinus lepideus HHB14362 ss-1]|uniref:Cysteine protease n=1 Tax=Neolentinus lepideus HHB14362 ss-1 TaxID=1314782 RepID=A0A165RUL8_9AGAM|nr:hypothetical protein NEOLEDRAFT_1163305 [Neolentinus lepideus HHB14362 ss-1]